MNNISIEELDPMNMRGDEQTEILGTLLSPSRKTVASPKIRSLPVKKRMIPVPKVINTPEERPSKKRKTSQKKESIFYFAFDVYRVGPNGAKPGKYVFLTKQTRFNVPDDVSTFQWMVEDIEYREKSRRDLCKEEEDYTWFESECNLLKKSLDFNKKR
jgi:hypothetical protein